MSQAFLQKLDRSLKNYSVHADYWDAECGETHLACSERKFLEDNLDRMSDDQIELLTDTDNRFIAILKGTTESGVDVDDLIFLVSYIKDSNIIQSIAA